MRRIDAPQQIVQSVERDVLARRLGRARLALVAPAPAVLGELVRDVVLPGEDSLLGFGDALEQLEDRRETAVGRVRGRSSGRGRRRAAGGRGGRRRGVLGRDGRAVAAATAERRAHRQYVLLDVLELVGLQRITSDAPLLLPLEVQEKLADVVLQGEKRAPGVSCRACCGRRADAKHAR